MNCKSNEILSHSAIIKEGFLGDNYLVKLSSGEISATALYISYKRDYATDEQKIKDISKFVDKVRIPVFFSLNSSESHYLVVGQRDKSYHPKKDEMNEQYNPAIHEKVVENFKLKPETKNFDPLSIPEPLNLPFPVSYNESLNKILLSPSCQFKSAWSEQFDNRLGIDTIIDFGASLSAVRCGKDCAFVLSAFQPLAFPTSDPREAGKLSASVPFMNCICAGGICAGGICAGASPFFLNPLWRDKNSDSAEEYSNCLDYINGIEEVEEIFGLQSNSKSSLMPIPVIWSVAHITDYKKIVTPSFKREGDKIVLLGETRDEIGSSVYLNVIHGTCDGQPPTVNLSKIRLLADLITEATNSSLLESAQYCSSGGLAVAAAKSCISQDHYKIGARISYDTGLRADRTLFSETSARVLISIRSGNIDLLRSMANKHSVHMEEIGETGGTHLYINGEIDIDINTLTNIT